MSGVEFLTLNWIIRRIWIITVWSSHVIWKPKMFWKCAIEIGWLCGCHFSVASIGLGSTVLTNVPNHENICMCVHVKTATALQRWVKLACRVVHITGSAFHSISSNHNLLGVTLPLLFVLIILPKRLHSQYTEPSIKRKFQYHDFHAGLN